MVCAQLADKDGIMVSQACRSAMLHYRSELLTMLSTLTFYPLFMLGRAEEKQTLTVELYSDFEDDQVKILFSSFDCIFFKCKIWELIFLTSE